MFGNKGYGFKVNITNTFAMFGDLLHHSYIFESIGNAVMISAVIIGVLLILFGKFNSNWKLYAIISLFLEWYRASATFIKLLICSFIL